jgi:PhnB protein
MQFQPYLIFNGNCAEAMRFYERVLGGARIDRLMKMGDAPEPCPGMPPEASDLVMHARLSIGDRTLMASDTMPGQPYEGMKGFSVVLAYPTVEEARRVFDALADGGSVTMPMDKTFWAEAFGMVVDRFGTPWMVNGALAPM